MFIVTILQNVTLTVVFMMQPAGQISIRHVVSDFSKLYSWLVWASTASVSYQASWSRLAQKFKENIEINPHPQTDGILMPKSNIPY